MKKILLVAITILLSISLNAQNTMEHLKFKGVLMDGSLNEFVRELKKKGFGSEERFNDGTTILYGDFAGHRHCKVIVFAGESGNVTHLGVSLSDDEHDWGILSWQYFDLKEKLITKYGAPYYSFERFNTMYQPDTDGEKIYYARRGDCEYETAWKFENGHIKLLISHLRVDYRDYCYVSLIYVDKQNYDLDEDSALDDL